MALVLKDRVKETTTTTGTGTLTLAGAATGFQSFSAIGDGNTTYYCIVDSSASAWEVGIGTYTSSGTTLSRTTILESSNSGSAVSFGSGSKDVFCTLPAEKVANVPSGAVEFFAMNTAPSGWLKANGAAISRTTYADLYAAIGTTFGSGDGSTTFNVPDMRGYFPRGWADDGSVDSGRSFGSTQLDQMQRITGSVTTNFPTGNAASYAGAISGAASNFSAGTAFSGRGVSSLTFNSANSPDARVSSTTSGETRPTNLSLLACIKY
jgi:microcystin-dependent protein